MTYSLSFKTICLFLIIFLLPLESIIAQGEGPSVNTTIVCSPPPLPPSASNAANGAAYTPTVWEVGDTLRVKFLGGTNFLRNKVRQYAEHWEEYANINFIFVEQGSSDIRISFEAGAGFYSQVGKNALLFAQDQPTMNLGFSEGDAEVFFRRLILHEFGHALGLNHEHQHPDNNIQWNVSTVYDYFLNTSGWSEAVVNTNVLSQLPTADVYYCAYDKASIMHYGIPQQLTLDNFSVAQPTNLSLGDKEFIQLLYPDRGIRSTPFCGSDSSCLDFSTRPNEATCNSGSVSIRVAMGTAPYDIIVNGPISGKARALSNAFRIENFPTGTYDITLEDANGCEATEQFRITSNCEQNPVAPVSTSRSRSAIDTTESLLVLIVQEATNNSRILSELLPCTALPLDSIPTQQVPNANINKNRLWDIGQNIRVKILEGGSGTNELKRKIKVVANEWQQYANVRFQFVETGKAEIRIGFDTLFNNASQIGTEALLVKDSRWTMNFSLTDEEEAYQWWVIRHEFGHALGLLHEHVHPKNNIPWNKQAIYNYQKSLTDREVDAIFFDLPAEDAIYFCDYDRYSVMHYPVGNESTFGDFSIGYNGISEEDQRFIQKLYPFNNFRNSMECGFCADPNSCADRQLRVLISGQGSVTISGPNTDPAECQSTCSNSYEKDALLKLTATPKSGHRFVGWEEGNCSNETNSQCAIRLTNNTTLSAFFEPIPITNTNQELNIRMEGKGYVEVKIGNATADCTYNCTFINDHPLDFQLQAIPREGYRFVKWVGDYCASSTVPTCEFMLSTSSGITAMFEPIADCITVTITPYNSHCNEGKLSFNITEGIAPFQLQLEGPASGRASVINNKPFNIPELPAGNYTVILEDATGCSTTQRVSIANSCIGNNTTNSYSKNRTSSTDELIIIEETAAMIKEKLLTVKEVYPNPFREHTMLPFNLAKAGEVEIELFNSNGQQIYQKTQLLEAGGHQIVFGSDILQKKGLYIYHLRVDEQVVIGKMVRL